MKKIITASFILVCSSFLLSACGAKTASKSAKPTAASKAVELSPQERPYISLIPDSAAHNLKFKLTNIPSSVNEIEYQLVYNASDNGMVIQKGVGGTIKKNEITGSTIERNIMLGTESCTNGCKQKYDDGVNGGDLTLNFYTDGGGVSTSDSPFVLKNAADILKDSKLAFDDNSLSLSLKPADKKEIYILIKNYGYPADPTVKSI
ncbi:MAG TPA: hypothetical protein VF828_00400, partial [Patescibacteria group bacterium]